MSSLEDEVELMELLDRDMRENRMVYFKPVEKHKQMFELGATKRERMFAAGNGVGKSESAAYEDACHLTGDYPDWWTGIRYPHPVKMWIASETSVLSRDIMQTKLCGPYGVTSAFGTGFIPKDRFADRPTLARGVTDAFDTIQVTHKTNGVIDGVSTGSFKSYEQGREKLQGENLDYGHCDEEPPMDIYSEMLARIRSSDRSRMSVTFTPLHGRTDLYNRFAENHPDRALVTMSLAEATWYSEGQKQKMVEGYTSHERDARRYGIPLLGSGRVFMYDEAMIKEPYLDYVPPHWWAIWGIDFGIGHPFAAALLLWDKDLDVLHVHAAVKIKGDETTPWMTQPLFHAQQMKVFGASVPVSWPHDGHQRKQGQGSNDTATLAAMYRRHGLKMLHTHATNPEGGYGIEAVLQEVDERIMTNRFKVSAHLAPWFEEYRFYHRKEGLIVPINNDILDATWKAVMMKRFAKQVPLGNWVQNQKHRAQQMGIISPGASDEFFGI